MFQGLLVMTILNYSLISVYRLESFNFMNCLWEDGHPMFCILRCTQHMLHPQPRFDVIDRLLRRAADSPSGKYFHLLMRATIAAPLDMEEILRDFWAPFMTRNLQHYRSDILGGTTSSSFRCT